MPKSEVRVLAKNDGYIPGFLGWGLRMRMMQTSKMLKTLSFYSYYCCFEVDGWKRCPYHILFLRYGFWLDRNCRTVFSSLWSVHHFKKIDGWRILTRHIVNIFFKFMMFERVPNLKPPCKISWGKSPFVDPLNLKVCKEIIGKYSVFVQGGGKYWHKWMEMEIWLEREGDMIRKKERKIWFKKRGRYDLKKERWRYD